MQDRIKRKTVFTQKCDTSQAGLPAWRGGWGWRWAGVLALLGVLGAPQLAKATLLISEVFYDAAGSDDGLSFVEIFGDPGSTLDGVQVVGVNGADGRETHLLNLTGVIPEDGFFVLADRLTGGGTLVSEADFILNFDLQNGPDSVLLRSGGVTLDAVGYGEFLPEEFFLGEGTAAPGAAAGSSVARLFANIDTNDNLADFVVATPTAGWAPMSAVPEPGTACLLGLGLAGLQIFGGTRIRRSAHGSESLR